jgi:glycine C-acetyltransferase
MPMLRLETVLDVRLKELERSGRLKGEESVIAGVVPTGDGKGPRYLLQGHGDRPFLRMNSNSYLGLAVNAKLKAAEDEAVGRYGTGPGLCGLSARRLPLPPLRSSTVPRGMRSLGTCAR